MLRLHKYKKLHQSKYSKDKEVKVQNLYISLIFILSFNCVILAALTFLSKPIIFCGLENMLLFHRLEQSNISFRQGLFN